MQEGRKFYRREFLNSAERGGMAAIEVEVGSYDPRYVDATFDITDCNRKVALEFGVYSQEDADAKREKIRKFRLAVVAFEKAFIAELDARYPLKLPKAE